MVKISPIFLLNQRSYEDGVRVIANKGGTRSGKTYSLLQLLLSIAEGGNFLISVVSESMPHLKRGALRDFDRILHSAEMIEGRDYQRNQTDHTFRFESGSAIEFFSVDNADKVQGAQRDILFINECNHVRWETYRQLAVRTSGTIFLDWNPTAAFWYDEKLNDKEGVTLIHSTYKDNPFLDRRQVEEIESNKGDKNWWRVFGLGLTGSNEGQIYTDWDIVDDLPKVFRFDFYCVDFGFVHDPTAILHVCESGGEIFVDEIRYQRGLDNNQIADILKDEGAHRLTPIVCDSAEPKSIAEINANGFNAVGVRKTADSITVGIQILQRRRLHVTRRSVGTIEELRNYSWRQDRDGNWLNVPVDLFNHALDALRYGALTYLQARRPNGTARAHVLKF